jgi:hypothetical protein
MGAQGGWRSDVLVVTFASGSNQKMQWITKATEMKSPGMQTRQTGGGAGCKKFGAWGEL